MCGIVGFIDKKVFSVDVLKAMMNQMVHRGPDGSGSYLDGDIALGHRRLSIIDIEEGGQPMKNEDGSLICIFNGEIYNYQELKRELETAGHFFATKSDTEVLLHGYEMWKEELPGKLRGMFAFAIWDKREKELFCARDYFGIKPFYYYKKKETFMFGSEIKCFLPHPDFKKELNKEQLELYLTYQYSPGESTFFKYVYKLPPAHILRWKDGEIELRPYWKPEFAPDEMVTEKEWGEKIGQVIKNSVAVHKISDVEVGSFLSSGIDSSYIAALSGVDQTFTIGYKNDKYDESKLVKEFSQDMNGKNQVFYIRPELFWENLSTIQYYMDEPLADASAVALYFLNQEASKQVKVCLSGEGADEVFGGYNIYKEPFMCKCYDKIPQIVRSGIGFVAGMLPQMSGINFLVRHRLPLEERYIGNTCLFTEKEKKKLLRHYSGKTSPIGLAKSFRKDADHLDDVSKMQMTDINLWLVGDILLKADKMSMANSLEVRVPFLDKEVFEVARQIPTKFRVDKKETKIALRKAAKEIIGEKAAGREKLGFPVPVRAWMRQEPYVSYIKKEFESNRAKEFFHVEFLLRLLDDHVSGKRDCWREIWCVYMFLVWYKVFF